MKQTGFTLIELMIAMALGLIVVASATLLFLSGQRNLVLQNSASSLQDDQTFGLSYIASRIRLANLNNSRALVQSNIEKSGIIFNKNNLHSGVTANANFDSEYASLTTSNESNFTSTSGAVKNDQLVIQYRPAEVGGFDCTGREITTRNEYIVERYFVRTDTNAATHETESQEKQVLACAAGRYSIPNADEDDEAETPPALGSSFYNNGEIILRRVELFKVRFLVQDGTSKKYITLEDYKKLTSDYPRVLSVQLAVISRASETTTESAVPMAPEFNLWSNFKVTLNSDQPRRYLRTPLVQTVALRNALGDR